MYSLPINCTLPASGIIKGVESGQLLSWSIITEQETGVMVLNIEPLNDNVLQWDSKTCLTITYRCTDYENDPITNIMI
jgi:hypothetical protein